jgi:hypothetical protein
LSGLNGTRYERPQITWWPLARSREVRQATSGSRTFRALLPEWLAEREHAVSRKTYVADRALPRLTLKALAALQISAVTEREVTRALIALNGSGLA